MALFLRELDIFKLFGDMLHDRYMEISHLLEDGYLLEDALHGRRIDIMDEVIEP